MDGYLKIKTKIDNKNVDKGITELENKIKKLQTDNASSSKEQDNLQQEINQYEKLKQQAEEYRNTIQRLKVERKSLISGGLKNSDVPRYNLVTSEIDQVKQKYAQATTEIDKQTPKIEKVYAKLDKVKAKQTENNAKITEFKQKIEQINLNKIQKSLDNVGKNIQSQIGKIGKMAMAVVGIRTAWGAVRSAISMVSQYNSQVSADFEYMRYCIANALAPAVEWLTKLLYTLLSYINAIASAWFGVNLFANSSAKAFQKMQKGASGTAKSAKEIQKSLQGFDEINILQDNTSLSNDDNSGGVTTPSVNLSGMQGEVPGWIQWIMDNGEIVRKILEGIATAVLVLKGNLDLLQGCGIFLIIDGVVSLVRDLKTYLDDPTWSNFAIIMKDVAEILTGIGLVLGVYLTNPLGLILLVIGQILSIVGGMIVEFQAIIDFIENPSWENFSQTIRNGISSMGLLGDAILWVVDNVFGGWDNVTSLLETVGTWIYDNVIKPVGDFFAGLWDKIKEIFEPVIEFFSGIWNKVLENIKIVIDNIKQIFMFLWNKLCEIFSPVAEFFGGIFSKAYESIKRVFSSIGSFFSGIWNKIKDIFGGIGQKIGDAISGTFKSAVNAVLRTIENVLNTPIRAVNKLIGVINAVPGINLGYLSTFSLPRLAKGGVIAQPTTAIIGEAGKEAVVPLENNLEWLDILATKIASKIDSGGGSFIINMDSRTIQRGIAKRQQELAFAKNGR